MVVERAYSALAQDYVRVALREKILGRHQPLLERRRDTALEKHRPLQLAQLFQEREVLHVARADLKDVDVLGDFFGERRVDDLAHDRKIVLFFHPPQRMQAFLA